MANAIPPRRPPRKPKAEHLCMAMRGIRKPGSVTTTSAVRGSMRTNAATRAEALGLLRGT